MEVPISGAKVPGLVGQVTCSAGLSMGAARSEPSDPSVGTAWRSMPVPAGWSAGTAAGGVPGVPGCRVYPGCAHYTGVDECIYRVITKARLGQGRARSSAKYRARTSARTVQNSAITDTRTTRHPDHPTPGTRHPEPTMYPGYLVTRCRPYGYLLLPYPISAKVSSWTCVSRVVS